MAESETVAEEVAAQEAPQEARIVGVPAITYRSSFNLLEILRLYDIGAGLLPKREMDRWRTSFALAVSLGGLWSAQSDGQVEGFAAFWRTKKPYVNLGRELPQPDPEGNYAYICWMWRFGEFPLARALQRHVQLVSEGAEFISWHDQRSKTKRRKRSKLWVLDIADETAARVLDRRNGSH